MALLVLFVTDHRVQRREIRETDIKDKNIITIIDFFLHRMTILLVFLFVFVIQIIVRQIDLIFYYCTVNIISFKS